MNYKFHIIIEHMGGGDMNRFIEEKGCQQSVENI